MRYSDIHSDERQKIYDEIESKAKGLGQDIWRASEPTKVSSKFGLCSSCKNLEYAKTETRLLFLRCSEFESKLRENEPIVECTEYSKKFQLSLEDMWAIAILIDPPKKKAGFIDEDYSKIIPRARGKIRRKHVNF